MLQSQKLKHKHINQTIKRKVEKESNLLLN